MVERRSYTIIDAALRLHGETTGSSEGLTEAEIADLGDWLRWRLVAWELSAIAWCRPFDDAAKALVVAALVEYGAHGRKRTVDRG